jgi:hypothetical protein
MLPKGRGINSLTQTQAAPACAINQGLGFAIVHDNLHSWANRSPTILRFHARFSSDPWVVLAEGCRSRMTQIDPESTLTLTDPVPLSRRSAFVFAMGRHEETSSACGKDALALRGG